MSNNPHCKPTHIAHYSYKPPSVTPTHRPSHHKVTTWNQPSTDPAIIKLQLGPSLPRTQPSLPLRSACCNRSCRAAACPPRRAFHHHCIYPPSAHNCSLLWSPPCKPTQPIIIIMVATTLHKCSAGGKQRRHPTAPLTGARRNGASISPFRRRGNAPKTPIPPTPFPQWARSKYSRAPIAAHLRCLPSSLSCPRCRAPSPALARPHLPANPHVARHRRLCM